MVEWRSVGFALAFIVLCFFAIPIKIGNVAEVEQRMLFASFVKEFNKSYEVGSEPYESRFKYFKESLKKIEELNKGRGETSEMAVYGLTKFSDLSPQEFDEKYLAYQHRRHTHTHKHTHHPPHKNIIKRSIDTLPRIVDWREKGVVSGIKDQGFCGACWAFSTVETVESMEAIKTGKLRSFSTQEIIDCARNGNMGCNGGDTCNLLQWLVENKVPIAEETHYPLVLKTEACKLKGSEGGVYIASNYTCDYLVDDENVVLNLLAYHGPVAVAVNALPWQYYMSGIIQFHCDGSLESLNHAVQLVGYNLDSSPPYYLVRNSWGKSFGESGYLRLALGSNMCGKPLHVPLYWPGCKPCSSSVSDGH